MKFLLVLFLFLNINFTFSQSKVPWGIGAVGIYNFQTNGAGVGFRAYVPLTRRIAVSPQFSYFFPFNVITEYYAGIALQYSFLSIRNWSAYALGGLYYNRWLNYEGFQGHLAVPNNLGEEAGIGLMNMKGCIRPFVEQRYNLKWKEANLQMGVLFILNDCLKNKRQVNSCPSYR